MEGEGGRGFFRTFRMIFSDLVFRGHGKISVFFGFPVDFLKKMSYNLGKDIWITLERNATAGMDRDDKS